jgi:hypothetical protein
VPQPDLVEHAALPWDRLDVPAGILADYHRDERRARWLRPDERQACREAIDASGVTVGLATVGGAG